METCEASKKLLGLNNILFGQVEDDGSSCQHKKIRIEKE